MLEEEEIDDPSKTGNKINIVAMLNYCHKQFEEANEKYKNSLKSVFSRGLRAVLIAGVQRPKPIKSNLPTIEFRFNKVEGHYEW